MSQKRQYAEASIKVDELNIVEDGKYFLKVWSTIVRSGVYDYPDGAAFKPASELLKAVRSARYAKLVMGRHPDTLVVMAQDQIFGGVEKPFWERNRMRALLSWDKQVTPPAFLDRIREAARGIGKMLNASIGFYFEKDPTPGMAPDVNTGKMRKYDYAIRKIMIDHTAVGDFKGRCRAPRCGLGLGIDSVFRRISFGTAKVVKRGEEWCIIHTHGEKAGTLVKGSCHKEKSETEAMHRAIEVQKHGGATADFYKDIHGLVKVDSLSDADYKLFFGAAERPTKVWMENCMLKAKSFADEPGAFCNWLFHNGPEKLKQGFGSSSVSTKKGGINVSENQTEESDYAKCIKERKAEDMTEGEAAEACKALRTDQETAYEACIAKRKAEGKTDAEAADLCKVAQTNQEDELSPWQKCIKKHTDKDVPMAEAIEKCKTEGIAKTDAEESEEKQRQACIKAKQEIEGMTPEEASNACTPKVDQGEEQTPPTEAEPLPTPLEQCIANRKDTMGESEEVARAWCEDEEAGLHKPTEEIVGDIENLAERERKLNSRRG